MTNHDLSLLGDAMLRTYFEFERLHRITSWWHWIALVTSCIGILTFVIWMYRRDSVEIRSGMAFTLLLLRVFALAGILVTFLNLEKRTERKVVRNSRVVVLIDTSQSMGLSNVETSAATVQQSQSRMQSVIKELADGTLIPSLREQHDVLAYRFSDSLLPQSIGSFPKNAVADDIANVPDETQREKSQQRVLITLAGSLLAGSLLLAMIFVFTRGSLRDVWAWTSVGSTVCLLAGLVTAAVLTLRYPETVISDMLNRVDAATISEVSDEDKSLLTDDLQGEQGQIIDWESELVPRGIETRLAGAIRHVIEIERGGPIAGIVLLSDGNNNAGIGPETVIQLAQDARIPVYTIGLGSDQRPTNVRMVDIEAPVRAYPTDGFKITGYLHANGMDGQTVKVDLASAAVPVGDNQPEFEFTDEQRIQMGKDGEVVPVQFSVLPQEPGNRVYRLTVTSSVQDHDSRDNQKIAKVQIVARKTRVLLIASGPTREYRFLRTMLYRDKDTLVDVILQSAGDGVSQEADNILFDFPSDAAAAFKYDCVIAFDADWSHFSLDQVDLLDRLIAEKAGGLIAIAGPVVTPEWIALRQTDSRMQRMRGLYPVVFFSGTGEALRMGRHESSQLWPLQLTREGQQAEFLWLDDTLEGSERAWADFDGVYGYFSVKEPKPGAKVYARFSDPVSAIDSRLPIFLAGHFYGAGRVFFIASGEMWRLRQIEDGYFEQFYTKLIRHVSQGRLLQDSTRGLLMVDKQRCLLGDLVNVRASLSDDQHNPLTEESFSASLIMPDGTREDLVLRRVKDVLREGFYATQFTVIQEGDFRIELPLPGAVTDELLVRDVRVRLPDLENQDSERNDALLSEIAKKTDAVYFAGIDAAVTESETPTLSQLIAPRSQETYLPATPDQVFERLLMTWLVVAICGALSLEWLLRRLHRLA